MILPRKQLLKLKQDDVFWTIFWNFDRRRVAFSNLFMAGNQLLTEEISQSRGSIKRFSRSERWVGGCVFGRRNKKLQKISQNEKLSKDENGNEMMKNGPYWA